MFVVEMFVVEMFGEKRRCRGEVYDSGRLVLDTNDYEEMLWVERGEEMYALLSPQLRNKKVLVVQRNDWIKGELV